ncbi:MAG TPA: dTMP kinase [Oculatellaceae cyanobacterium]
MTSTQPSFPGCFVTLEGPEGAGKTTQVKLLSKQLEILGIKHLVTRDPGGTPLGRQIRRILLNPENPVHPTTELLLYQADRAQHVSELIMPALQSGTLVICDRYIDSTVAYQGYGRNIDLKLIAELNEISTGGLRPQMTILFDIESSDGLSRLHPGGHDRLEREALEFHLKVRQGYLNLTKQEPERWRTLDASKPLSVVQMELRKLFLENIPKICPCFDLSGLLEKSAT